MYEIPVEFEAKLSEDEMDALNQVVLGKSIYKFPSLYKKAYNHFVSEMPYRVAKARSAEPGHWLQDRFRGEDETEES